MNVYMSDRDPTVKPGAGAPVRCARSEPIQPWLRWTLATRLKPDTMSRTTDFEMISITVSDSRPRQQALMLQETDKPSRVTLMAVGTNQNCFTASAAPQHGRTVHNPRPKPGTLDYHHLKWGVRRSDESQDIYEGKYHKNKCDLNLLKLVSIQWYRK